MGARFAVKSTPKISVIHVAIHGISSKEMGVYFFLRFLDCHDLLIRNPSLKSIHSRILQLLWPTYVSPSDGEVKSLERHFFSSLTEVLSFHRFPSQNHVLPPYSLFNLISPSLFLAASSRNKHLPTSKNVNVIELVYTIHYCVIYYNISNHVLKVNVWSKHLPSDVTFFMGVGRIAPAVKACGQWVSHSSYTATSRTFNWPSMRTIAHLQYSGPFEN